MNNLEDKMHSDDRILVLQVMEGKSSKTNTGLIDNSLFTGGNQLHAYLDTACLWKLKYEKGILPEPLKQRFTSFSQLFNFCVEYFKKRNIEIKEVVG